MAGSTFAFATLAVWLLGGLAGYYYLYRHGHPSGVWLLGGLILGPFSLPVFMERVEKSSHVLVEHGASRSGNRKVVVGLDGSPSSQEALRVAEQLVVPGTCCLILCEVVDYDTETDPRSNAAAEASARLEKVAAGVSADNVVVEVLAGRPAQALAEAAETHDADIVVVGSRGRGLSRRLLGSVSEDLLKVSRRPVLVAHRHDA